MVFVDFVKSYETFVLVGVVPFVNVFGIIGVVFTVVAMFEIFHESVIYGFNDVGTLGTKVVNVVEFNLTDAVDSFRTVAVVVSIVTFISCVRLASVKSSSLTVTSVPIVSPE